MLSIEPRLNTRSPDTAAMKFAILGEAFFQTITLVNGLITRDHRRRFRNNNCIFTIKSSKPCSNTIKTDTGAMESQFWKRHSFFSLLYILFGNFQDHRRIFLEDLMHLFDIINRGPP